MQRIEKSQVPGIVHTPEPLANNKRANQKLCLTLHLGAHRYYLHFQALVASKMWNKYMLFPEINKKFKILRRIDSFQQMFFLKSHLLPQTRK